MKGRVFGSVLSWVLKRNGFCLCLILAEFMVDRPGAYWTSGFEFSYEPVTKHLQCITSVPLTVHINPPAHLLSCLHLSFTQLSFSDYPTGTRFPVFHGLIRAEHLIAASAREHHVVLICEARSRKPDQET